MSFFRLVCTILAIGLLAGPGVSQQDGAQPLFWGADSEGGAPYIFKDPDNPKENVGFEKDLVAALARQLSRPMQFKQNEFNTLLLGLERGDYNFVINGLEITPDRIQKVRFSRPYYVYRLQLAVRDDEQRFKTLAECRGRKDVTIGTLEDTAASRLLDKLGIPKRTYPGQVEPYSDLVDKQIDGVLMDLPIALYYGQKDPKLKYALKNPKVKFTGEPFEKGYYAIAFRLNDEALAAQVDVALEHLIADGTLRRIYEKWGLWNDDQNELAQLKRPEVALGESSAFGFAWYFPLLLEGAWTTVYLTIASMALAVAIGLPIAVVRLYAPAPFRWLAILYVEFFRGIPVLLLLYFLYYGLPELARSYELGWSLKLAADQAAILGFGLNYAAYEAEIYRAGISSIPHGQWEAAASLGMPSGLTLRRIILPQAIRVILPPMTNDFVALFKDTSVVSVIAVVELSKQYQILSKTSMKYLEIGLVTAALYLIMSVPLGYLSRYLEQRWSGGD